MVVRYLKTRNFSKWAKKEKLSDTLLSGIIAEFESGLYDAKISGYLYKKRIGLVGRGKRAGARTIIFYQQGTKLVFCLGFAKNNKVNLNRDEKRALDILSKALLSFSDVEIKTYLKTGALVTIT
ncbi:MAG: hypothetical protein ACI9CF_001455 [Candidatus Omnitrophota bacterium]|jgi:hypothetical protein